MAPNFMHQRRIDSRVTVIPRSAKRSSMEWSGTPAIAKVEAILELDCVENHARWESVALIYVHALILSITAS